jgi:DNA-binding SARP family transcriptional activator
LRLSNRGHGAAVAARSAEEHTVAEDPAVRLRVFGPPALDTGGQPLTSGIRGKAWELLTYLAVHPGGAIRDAILEALYPDADLKHAVMMFHAAIHDIRAALRQATGLVADFIDRSADRYRLSHELIAVDVQGFRAALSEAARALDDRARSACFQRALDLYQDHLAAEQAYEWIEPEREALRRHAVDAANRLAVMYESSEPEQALAVLERAIEIDPYGEAGYRKLMSLQARLGHADAVRRTYRLLETHLEEIGVDPDEETRQLLWKLTRGRERPPAAVGPADQ